ncbi:MAG: hypothetical protein WAT79_16630 [Saprospiraceae bacterium]
MDIKPKKELEANQPSGFGFKSDSTSRDKLETKPCCNSSENACCASVKKTDFRSPNKISCCGNS